MKKEFLLLSVLISSAIFVFLIYPISNLIQLDEKNITKLDKKEKPQSNQFSFNKDNNCFSSDSILFIRLSADSPSAGATFCSN